jgi:hypothetical protein
LLLILDFAILSPVSLILRRSEMQMTVADDVYEQVALLARAWDLVPSDVIRRLLAEFSSGTHGDTASPTHEVAVHAIYAGVRTDGRYDPATGTLTITTGALAGRTYKSPSGAAVALVAALKPTVHPNRNGWWFWVQSDSGELLKTLRGSSASR